MKIEYRPEIDGLRAIAVIAIIFYHARLVLFGINFFPGGFLGIDIFFVISGYVISQRIYKDYRLTNKILIKDCVGYIRRYVLLCFVLYLHMSFCLTICMNFCLEIKF